MRSVEMSNREEFEKAYTNAFIGEELKGLESIIFARFEIGGEYAQDKVATAYAMWQSRVPEGYVVVPKEPSEDMIMAGCMEHGGYDVIDSKSIYKSMIEAVEK
jgi:hypothetical protein